MPQPTPASDHTDHNARHLNLSDAKTLFIDEEIQSLISRAYTYLSSGVPVHFRGPAGAGKSTLAYEIAGRFDRPVVLVTGDAWFTAANLVGAEGTTRTRRVVDNYIASVKRVDTETSPVWTDNILTEAVEHGWTLIYDEFTRSPAAANNPLLSVLEERRLVLSASGRDEKYIDAHPEFRAIFTSNPDDYAAISAPQDALLDRMVTFDLSWHSLEAEAGIVSQRTGLAVEQCYPIVRLVRAVRDSVDWACPPSLRASIMIGRVVREKKLTPDLNDHSFVQLCMDVLESRAPRDANSASERQAFVQSVHNLIISQLSNTAGCQREAS